MSSITRRAFSLFVALLIYLLPLAAADRVDTCAVTVNVRLANGLPIQSILVDILDAEHRIEYTKQVQGPVIKVCDLGFGKHQLRIGSNECHPVVLENIEFMPGNPIQLEAILNDCAFGESSGNVCRVYLRVKTP